VNIKKLIQVVVLYVISFLGSMGHTYCSGLGHSLFGQPNH